MNLTRLQPLARAAGAQVIASIVRWLTNMDQKSTWRPSAAPFDPAAPDPVAAVHFWASWNHGIDRGMDSMLQSHSYIFDDSLSLRSCDFDREENWPLVEQARVVNLPALVLVVRGVPQETIIGTRDETELRSRILEWRAHTVAI